jgi:hypothetical protein
VTTGACAPVRLDAVLQGRAAVLTAGQPGAGLVSLCQHHRLLLVRVTAAPAPLVAGQVRPPGHFPGTGLAADRDCAEVSPTGGPGTAALQALIRNPAMALLVRPDRVIADVATAPGCPARPGACRPTRLPRPAGKPSPRT